MLVKKKKNLILSVMLKIFLFFAIFEPGDAYIICYNVIPAEGCYIEFKYVTLVIEELNHVSLVII